MSATGKVKQPRIWQNKEKIMNGKYRYKTHTPQREYRTGTASDGFTEDATKFMVNWCGMRITHSGSKTRGQITDDDREYGSSYQRPDNGILT